MPIQISALTLKGAPVGSDEIELQETASGGSFKATLNSLADAIGAGGGAVDSVNGKTGVVKLHAQMAARVSLRI